MFQKTLTEINDPRKMMLPEKNDHKCPENMIPDWNIKKILQKKAMIGSQKKMRYQSLKYRLFNSEVSMLDSAVINLGHMTFDLS